MEATFYYGIGALVVELRYISIAPQSEPDHVAAFRVPYYEKLYVMCKALRSFAQERFLRIVPASIP